MRWGAAPPVTPCGQGQQVEVQVVFGRRTPVGANTCYHYITQHTWILTVEKAFMPQSRFCLFVFFKQKQCLPILFLPSLVFNPFL